MTAQPLLSIRDLEVVFRSRTSTVSAVRGASLDLYAGHSLAIVGESGSGKSTTAHAVIGLLPGGGRVTGGSIRFDGQELVGAPASRLVALRGSGIGLVPQDPMSNLNPVYRVGAQIRESLRANNVDVSRSTYRALLELTHETDLADTPAARLYLSSDGRRDLLAALSERGVDVESLADRLVVGFTTRLEVQSLLRQLGLQDAAALAERYVVGASATDRVAGLLAEAGLADAARRARQYPHEFSGGMRQRALIAMALAARPKLLIADEPTSALDVTVQRQILDHLGLLTRELDTALLFITHDLGLAAERAEQLVVMYKGRVVESGPSLEILTNPRHPYTKRLVQAAPSLASRRIQQAKDQGEEAAVIAVSGGEGLVKAPDLLEVRGVSKVFQLRGSRPWDRTDFTAVDDVSLTVARGSTAALVGESGSGKSTVANMVLSLLEPTKGTIVFDGVDTASLSRHELFDFRSRVQPVFQDPYGSLDPMFSIFRIIEEPLRTHRVGGRAAREARVRELLDQVALPASTMRRYPNELSGGQRQRVAVARALALQPQLVVLDEAVSALDVLVQAQVLELLGRLQRELSLTYLFITHDLAVVRQMADQVYVMEKGRVVEQGPTDRVFEEPLEEYTKALLAAIPGSSINLHPRGH
ncbi:MAG: ABC transporter ATP-binding protein [Bifidobacteriaceae bacterium]|jgi:peptide/nickel transport system ATP-binding protein|nr:ABC transporter ATP-binding protein [Bifidobacteriaceae bacterium]